MSKILHSCYHVETMIPGIKSWGCLPEHDGITLKRAREIQKHYREEGLSPRMKTRLLRTTVIVLNVQPRKPKKPRTLWIRKRQK